MMEICVMIKKMIEKVQKRKLPVGTIAVYLGFVLLMAIVVLLKNDYYIDEIYSYGLSNDTGVDINMTFEYDKTYTPGASLYWDYVEVQKGEQFDYASVWRNQANDVHPPLYYAVLHTICSFFPDTFSKWYAGVINIASALLTLFLIRKIILIMTDNKYIRDILSVVFILTNGMLGGVSFFRMYMMAMMWVTLLTYLLLKQVEEKQDRRFYIGIALAAFAGALTHYYVIVYEVLISCVYGIYLLYRKRIKETLLFVLTMAVAGVASVAVFPAMLQHIFFGYRGTEAFGNLGNNADWWESVKEYYGFVDVQMFGKTLSYIIVALVMLAVMRCFKNYFEKALELTGEGFCFGFERKAVIRYALMLIPCVLYFILISRIAFDPIDRYISPIYAVFYVAVMCIVCMVFRYFFKGRIYVAASVLLATLLISGNYINSTWPFLFRSSISLLTAAEAHSDYDCICVMGGSSNSQFYPAFVEYSNYKSITVISFEELEENGIGQWASPDGIIVTMIASYEITDELIQKVKEDNGYASVEKIASNGFNNTYFLSN